MPLVAELDAQRAADLGLERLRPWDMEVDPQNRPPLRAVRARTRSPEFVEKTREIFDRLSPELAEDFDSLRQQQQPRPGTAARASSPAGTSARWRSRASRSSS